jgi:hypothetical protein
MSNPNSEQIPGSTDLGANTFYQELTGSLQIEPITRDMGVDRPEEKPIRVAHTLRRLWIPQAGDVLESPELLGLVIKYDRLAAVCSNIGLSLLGYRVVQAIADDERSPERTEEVMGALAEDLPQELCLSADSVTILGKTGPLPGKRFVGFRFASESIRLVQQDQDKVLGALKVGRLPKRDRPHLSLFSTEDPVVARELETKLRTTVTLPGKLLLGKAIPMRTNLPI